METVIFTGLLISGYLANDCNNDNKHTKKIQNKHTKKIQNQSKQEEINNELQEEIDNELQEEIDNELQEEIDNELQENNLSTEPVEYNGLGDSFNINELDDDIAGRKKKKIQKNNLRL